jgi:catechol 2,3-dioxygenase-like lactoylglutathione lyase family enzyme
VSDAEKNRFRVERLDHVELFVLDRYAAAKWYERVLGLTICTQHEHWAEDPKGPLMLHAEGGDSAMLALFEGRPQEGRETAGFHRAAFSVDAASFVQFLGRLHSLQLTDHNGTSVTAADVADHGATRSIYFCDPHGHRLELTTYDVDALVLLQSDSATDPVEADSPEIEILDADDAPPVVTMPPDEQGDVPWMCHFCSFRLSSSDGLICSICYRSTCVHCVQSASDRMDKEAPVCKACAQGAVG